MTILALVGALVALVGSAFLLLAAIGIVRMPDVFNRMQAGTKATTLGSIFFLVGVGLVHPAWLPKLVLLVVFIVFTNPVSSHALARASHFRRLADESVTVQDDLSHDIDEEVHQ